MICMMGDKVFVINVMKKVGVLCVLGFDGLFDGDDVKNKVYVKCIGF